MSQSQHVLKEYGSLQVGGAEISSKQNYAELAAASTLTIADSGKTFYLNSATEFPTTLPAVADAAGFKAKFVVKAAPAGANYSIASPAADISGAVLTPADALGAAAATAGTPITTISFVDAKAAVGDYVEIECDGSAYYVSGLSTLFDGVAFAV
jgi:hypothetical protein